MRKKFSVAIATFNGEKYIHSQIMSILNQTVKVDEIVICDDNSNDNTVKIIEEFISDKYPIKLFKNKDNLGYALNFLKCIDLCESDYIFLCDQDDVWFENKVEIMNNFLKKNPKNLCWMHDCSLTNAELEIVVKSKIQNIKKYFMNTNAFVMGACMLIKKEAKEIIYPYAINVCEYGHDNWISFALRSINKVKVLNKSLMYYRRHGRNTSQKIFNSLEKNSKLEYLIKKLLVFFSKNNFKKKKIEKIKSRNKDFKWSIQLYKNISNKNYKIINAFSLRNLTLAKKISQSNLISRLIIIIKLFSSGYYEYRSNFYSAIDDFLFS